MVLGLVSTEASAHVFWRKLANNILQNCSSDATDNSHWLSTDIWTRAIN